MSLLNLNDEKTKWAVFFLIFFSGALIIGLNTYSFGLFVKPLEDEFGWTREQISLEDFFSRLIVSNSVWFYFEATYD